MFPKVLISLLLVLTTLAVIHGASISTTQDSSNVRQQKSEEILKYLSKWADPCDDFYEYACGNYGKNIADYFLHKNFYGTWSVADNITKKLRAKVMEELRKSVDVTDTEADKKVKRFYAACMNTSTTEGVYVNRLKEVISEFGKMPLIEGEQWQEDDFDWVKLVTDIKQRTDIGIILNPKIVPDFTNNSLNRVALVQPDFQYNIPAFTEKASEEYQNVFGTKAYEGLVAGIGVEEDLALQTASEMFTFVAALAQAIEDVDLTPPSDLYALVNINEMQRKYHLAWDSGKLLKTALALDIEPSLVMIQPTYLQAVFAVIQNTPKRVVANYIFYTYLSIYFDALPFNDALIGSHCEELTEKYFEENLQNLCYRKHFSRHDEKLIDILWRELKVTFEEILKSNSLNWINNENTRQNALEKLRAMKLKIGNYEEIDFDQKLAELNINDHDLLGNVRAVFRMRANQSRFKMNQPPQFKNPPTFSAAYDPEENCVHLPISILQADNPWSLSYPYAINFGSLGFLMSHEMVHGFDDVGRYYDGSGNSRDWWDPTSLQEHQERAKCFAKQYESYSFRGHSLPHLKVQAENIADNGGLHLAFEAYQKWQQSKAVEKNLEMESLLGLNFTNNQLFFVSYSQRSCVGLGSRYSDSTYIHAPENFRVIGALSNFEEFAKAFNCPKGSAMNPVEKCKMY